jgi:7-carboxy-7-deazaguanine synthase
MEPLLPKALGSLRPGELLVSELFSSIQGETTRAGMPCFFIRLAGCHLRCAWCDTQYAFFDGRVMTVLECIEAAEAARRPLVEVTGGEPLLQKSAHALLEGLCNRGFEVLLETSGSLEIDKVDPRVLRIVDWKCPGSGMDGKNRPDVLTSLRATDEIKLVIQDRRDYEWARDELRQWSGKILPGIPVNFSPVFGCLESSALAAWILEDHLDVRLNLQLQKWIWPARTRGV